MSRQSVQKFIFQVFWLCFATLVPVSFSFWFHYRHLPHWTTYVIGAVMAVPAVAMLNNRERRER